MHKRTQLARVPDPSRPGDGADSLRTAYSERARLIALLAAIYPAVLTEHQPNQPAADAPDISDVIYLQTPRGQLSWHLHPDDVDEMFTHVVRVSPQHPSAQYDGHTTAEKHARIDELIADHFKEAALRRLDDECYLLQTGPEPPSILGGDQLMRVLQLHLEDALMRSRDPSLQVWRWLGGGRWKALTLSRVGDHEPAFDDDGYSDTLWELTSRRGTRHLVIPVRVDRQILGPEPS